MVYRDRAFCSHSEECGTTECMRWVDFDVETYGLPISLYDFKSDSCGFTPTNKPEDVLLYQTKRGDHEKT